MHTKSTTDKDKNHETHQRYNIILIVNRIFWMILFIGGSIVFAYWDNSDLTDISMGWFLSTSLWSAIIGIGYSIFDWLLRHKI